MTLTSLETMPPRGAARCALIGDEPLVIQCAELATAAGLQVVLVVTADAWVRAEATAAGVTVADPVDLAATLTEHRVDVLFSVANLRILKADVLGAVQLAINFHDGPLPGFGGVHVTTWALLAGEHEHAVTWHVMTEAVDGGAIVAEERFAVADDETAYTLNARCFEAAVRSFPAVAAAVAGGTLSPRAHGPGALRLYGRHERPAGRSLLDPTQPVAELARVVRALDLGDRTTNRIGRARLVGDGIAWLVAGPSIDDGTALAPGTVRADGGALLLGAQDGTLRLAHLTELDGTAVDAAAVAARLGGAATPPPASLVSALDAADAELSRHETAWIRRLDALAQPLLPEAGTGGGWDARPVVMIPDIDLALAAGVVATWAARLGGAPSAAVGVVDAATSERLHSLAPLVAPPVVTVTPDAQADQRADIAAAVTDALARGPWLVDLIARTPALAGTRAPGVVVDAGPERLPTAGEWLRIGLDTATGAVTLHHDRAALSAERATLAAGQLATMLAAAVTDAGRPLALLPICGPADLALLADLTGATSDHDRTHTVWDELRAGLTARGDEPALTSGATSLSGRQLLDAAERLATELRALGVRPGDRVGIGLPRRADMVTAVLATLATGAAYVPLDPGYPEERQRFVATDAGLRALIADPDHGARVAPDGCPVVSPGGSAADGAEWAAPTGPDAADVAYVIYTSGSTGRPKGVEVEHRQVVAFFAAMDRVIEHDRPGTWLALTSLSFDISVLELLWTLARRFHVVLAPDRAPADAAATRPVALSLFYFAAASAPDGYRLLLEGARFADDHGFSAVWTPERHFHDFGGPYPNPAVTGAAVAAVTRRVAIRAGSVVLPLHSPLRVAEEWSVVDNLSGGRAGISVAAGWMPEDFVLNPGAYADAKQRMVRDLDVVRRLWRGDAVQMPGPDGSAVTVRTLPRPVQPELPVWLTSAGSPSTFVMAGELGAGVLTHMLGQRPEVLAANIAAYREAWRAAGHAGEGHVALMVHTFVGDDTAAVRALVRDPLAAYLRTSVSLLKDVASAFPTFAGAGADADADDLFASLTHDELEQLLDAAVDRYCTTSGLIGTPDTVVAQARRFATLGVDEFACLIDFGVEIEQVLASLPLLAEVRSALAASAAGSAEELPVDSVATLVARHGVTHLQCTPSQAAMLAADPADRAALGTLAHLMVGGEALPTGLAAELRTLLGGRFTNMYGPTETTIWSLTHDIVDPPTVSVPIGRPVAGTTMAIVDANLQPLPPGTPGELVIGGEGVTRGYLHRPELTAERFTTVSGLGRAYRTGDIARVATTGIVEFLGRSDHQLKLRGHRIELGEIETVLATHPDVAQAVVVAHGTGGDTSLLAYVTPANGTRPDETGLRAHVGRELPEIMVPARAIVVDVFPLTPNGKIDRKALPAPDAGAVALRGGVPDDELERIVAAVWEEVLDRPVGRDDNFFEIGGHSLAAVKVFGRLTKATGAPLALTDVFQHPTVRAMALHLARLADPAAADTGDEPAAGSDRGSRRRQLLARRHAQVS